MSLKDAGLRPVFVKRVSCSTLLQHSDIRAVRPRSILARDVVAEGSSARVSAALSGLK